MNLEQYRAKLEKMNGMELRDEEASLKATYGGKEWTPEEWAKIKEIVNEFLIVQNGHIARKTQELNKKYNQNRKPAFRSFVGFLR